MNSPQSFWSSRSRTLALLLSASVTLGVAACTSPDSTSSAGTVNVVGVWTGTEAATFTEILAESGIPYTYTGSRNLDQLLQSDLNNGTKPDIVVVANPAELAEIKDSLQLFDPHSTGLTNYGSVWQNLVKAPGTNQQYAVVLKADLKGIVWYNRKSPPPRLTAVDGVVVQPTWAQLSTLTRMSKPWCMGLGANSGSGFPGTDWISQIMLRTYGPALYTRWATGRLPWNSPQVKHAFAIWGTVLNGVPGGSASALLTNYDDAGQPMFDSTPGCYLDNEASFITGSYGRADNTGTPGNDYNFFSLPAIGRGQPRQAYEVAANFAGMFKGTKNAPQAKKLMTFLASRQGQRLWAEHGDFSVDSRIPPTSAGYGGLVNQRIARILAPQPGTSASLCFGASDLMNSALSAAFYQTVLAYAADPHKVDSLLDQLELVRKEQSQTLAVKDVCGN